MIKSPCTKICQIDKNSGICIGCKRTTDEISQWQSYTDDEKNKILQRLSLRKFILKKSSNLNNN